MTGHLALKALGFLYQGNRLQIKDRIYAMTEDGEIVIVGQSSMTGEVFLFTHFLVKEWFDLIDRLDNGEKTELVFQIGLMNTMNTISK